MIKLRMSAALRVRCPRGAARLGYRGPPCSARSHQGSSLRPYSGTTSTAAADTEKDTGKYLKTESDIEQALSKPTWSVNALLPQSQAALDTSEITPAKLRHLLRLCALPPPASESEETSMLADLRAQLRFVREIQKVDTMNVTPLQAIRDETAAARKERVISLDTLKDALSKEVVLGKHHKRIRRDKSVPVDTKGAEDWDVLGQAPRKLGRYFVVEGKDS